jgi:CheY-like chemotaxis protein
MEKLGSRRNFLAVAMSGCGLNADKTRSKSVGFRHHLIKPFLPEELDPILDEARKQASQRPAGE